MIRYEYYITGEVFDEVTPEIIDKYYAEEFSDYLDEEVGNISDLIYMARKSLCTTDDVIINAKLDFARMIEENPYDYYLDVHEIIDRD